MSETFRKIQGYLLDLGIGIMEESEEEGYFVIEAEGDGISRMMIACEDPIVVMEQFIFELKDKNPDIMCDLLKKNRDIIHGAFALDETGTKVIFRDTLQTENLDLNELEASIHSLTLLLGEYSDSIIEFAKS